MLSCRQRGGERTLFLHSDAQMTNSGSVLTRATSSSSFAYGYLLSASSLTNTATGTLESVAHGFDACGLRADNWTSLDPTVSHASTVVNAGKLDVYAKGVNKAWGIELVNSTMENTGTVLVKAVATGVEVHCGLFEGYSRGVVVNTASTLTNFGSMEVQASAPGLTWGGADGLRVENFSSVYNEKGATLTVGCEADTVGYAVYLQAATLVNRGTLTAVSANGDAGIHMYMDEFTGNRSYVYNSGKLVVDALEWSGHYDATYSEIHFCDGTILTPYTTGGTVTLASGWPAGYMRIYFGGSLNDSGEPVLSSSGSSVIVSESSLVVDEYHISVMGDVLLQMGGDLSIAQAFGSTDFTSIGDASLTVDNGATAHNVAIGVLNATWNHAFTWKSGNTITQASAENAGDLVLRSAEATLGDGKLSANSSLTVGSSEQRFSLYTGTDGFDLTSGGGGSITRTDFYGGSSLSISAAAGNLMELNAVNFTPGDAATAATINLSNVRVSGNSHFPMVTTSAVTANLTNVTFVCSEANCEDLTSNPPMDISGGVMYLSSTLMSNSNVAVSGSLTLDFSVWAETLEAAGYDTLIIDLGDGVVFADDASLSGTMDGSQLLDVAQVNKGALTFSLPITYDYKITVGQEGGALSDDAVVLKAADYSAKTEVNVRSGKLFLEEGALVGSADTVITIGSTSPSGTDTTAALVNEGTMKGVVEIKGQGALVNAGTLYVHAEDSASADILLSATMQENASQLYLLDGSTTGELVEGETLIITATGTNKMTLGGTLGEVGSENEGEVVSLGNGEWASLRFTSPVSLTRGYLNFIDNVAISAGGDISIAANATLKFNGHALKVDNGGTMHQLTIAGDSYLFDRSMCFSGDTYSLNIAHQEGGELCALNGFLDASGTLVLGKEDVSSRYTAGENSSSLALSAGAGGSVTSAEIEAQEIYVTGGADAPMVLEALTVTSSSLRLTNVELRGANKLVSAADSGAVALTASNVGVVLNADNSADYTLNVPAQDAVAGTLYLSTTALAGAGVELSGSLTLDLSYWCSTVSNGAYEYISLSFAELAGLSGDYAVSATLGTDALLENPEVDGSTLLFALGSIELPVEPEPIEPDVPIVDASTITVGAEGTEHLALTTGDYSAVQTIYVLDGSLTIAEGVTVGSSTTKLIVGTNAAAEVVNAGILYGCVSLKGDGSMSNNGSIVLNGAEGDETLRQQVAGINTSPGSSFINNGIIDINTDGWNPDTSYGYSAGIDSNGTFVNNEGGSIRVDASLEGGGYSLAFTGWGETLVNAGSMELLASCTQGGAWGLDLYEASLLQAGTLLAHAEGADAESADISLTGDADAAVLHLLHGSVTGEAVEGETLEISGLGTAAVRLGGALTPEGEVAEAVEGGSEVTLSSSVALSNVSVELVDDVSLTMAEDSTLSFGKGTVGDLGAHVLSVETGTVLVDTESVVSNGTLKLGDAASAVLMDGAVLDCSLAGGTVAVNGGSAVLAQEAAVHRLRLSAASRLVVEGDLAVKTELRGEGLSSELELHSDLLDLRGTTANMAVYAQNGLHVRGSEVAPTVLDTVFISVAGSGLTMSDLTVSGMSSFSSMEGSLAANLNAVTFVLDASNSCEMMTLDANVLHLDVASLFDEAELSGSLTLNLSYWAELVEEGGYDTLNISIGSVSFDADCVVSAWTNSDATALAGSLNGNTVQFNVADFTLSEDLPGEIPPEPIVNGGEDGIVDGELSVDNYVKLEDGDVVLVGSVLFLNQEFISGTGGTLVTEGDQQLALSGVETIGYNLLGSESEENPSAPAAGAAIVIGKEGGVLNDADITLTGSSYNSAQVSVLSGLLTTSDSTTVGLGADETLLSIGSAASGGDAVTAAVDNAGTIAADVEMSAQSYLLNRGVIEGDVTLGANAAMLSVGGQVGGKLVIEKDAEAKGTGSFNEVLVHGSLYVGNSPGYWAVSAIEFTSGSDITFCLDGYQAATPAHYGVGTGTYSQLHVENSLTLTGLPAVTLEIGAGLLKNGVGEHSFALLTFGETARGELTAADITSLHEMFAEATLTGNTELLESYTTEWNAETGTLTLRAEIETAAAVALVSEDGSAIANTLWSSTSAVRSFARSAVAQLATPPVELDGITVWGSALGDYVSMSGFRSNAHGYAVGVDRQFCPRVRTGIALGQMFGDYTADRGFAGVEQDSIMVGLYSEYVRKVGKDETLRFTSYAAYGQVENDADTRVAGAAELPGSASWDDDVFALGSRAELVMPLSESVSISPFIGLEFLHGSQSSFTETYAGGSRHYRDGSMQVWSLPIGITLRSEIDLGDEQKLLPELTLAYVGDIARKDPHVRSSVFGVEQSHTGTKPGRSAFMLNVGTNWIISKDWSVGASYNLEARSHEVSQEANVSLRCEF